MGQLPQFVRQGEERKVKKSLLWESKPGVFLLSLIRTRCWGKIDGIKELINGNRDGKAKWCFCFRAERKRCNMCLLSQAREAAETRWNGIIWPFMAQAHRKNSTKVRWGPSPGCIKATLPDQVLSRLSFKPGQIPAVMQKVFRGEL